MSTVRRIARNTAALLIAQVLSYIAGFFSVMFMARYLGAENYGVLSFALALTGMFAILTDLGIGMVAVREIARDKSLTARYLVNMSAIKAVAVAVTFGLIALTINLMDYPQQTVTVVYLAGLALVITAFSQVFSGIFMAHERLEYHSLGLFLHSIAMLVGVVLAIRLELGIVAFALLWCFASSAVLLYSLAVYRRKFARPRAEDVAVHARVDRSLCKSLIRAALPLLLASVFGIIAYRIDMVMLSVMKGDAAVGLYSAGYRLIDALGFIPSAFVAALFPVLSQLHVSGQDSLRFAYRKSFSYLLLVGLPVAAGTVLLVGRIIIGVYGTEFADAAAALRILIWAAPFNFLNALLVTVLVSVNRQDLITRIVLLSMVLNVIGNLLLIPRYSYVGASVTTVATGALGCALYLHFVSRLVCRLQLHKLIIRPVIACGVMAGCLILLKHLNLFVVVPVAAVIYFATLYITRHISNEDIALIKQALRTR